MQLLSNVSSTRNIFAIFLENQAQFYSLWLRKIYPSALTEGNTFMIVWILTIEKASSSILLHQVILLTDNQSYLVIALLGIYRSSSSAFD